TYKYKRYYYDPVNSQSVDALSGQDIIFDFRNSLSLRRNGEQKVEIDGELFSAVGNFTGETFENPEMGAILAERRRINMFDRLKFGTPTFQLNVWRIATAHLRAGDFVRVNI